MVYLTGSMCAMRPWGALSGWTKAKTPEQCFPETTPETSWAPITTIPDPRFPADYDAFYEAISAPVSSHSLTLPYGQSTITFDAMVSEGTDLYRGKVANRTRWGGLQVQFTAKKPQRTPT